MGTKFVYGGLTVQQALAGRHSLTRSDPISQHLKNAVPWGQEFRSVRVGLIAVWLIWEPLHGFKVNLMITLIYVYYALVNGG